MASRRDSTRCARAAASASCASAGSGGNTVSGTPPWCNETFVMEPHIVEGAKRSAGGRRYRGPVGHPDAADAPANAATDQSNEAAAPDAEQEPAKPPTRVLLVRHAV